MISKRYRSGRITVIFVFLMVAVSVFFGLSLNVSQLLQERAHLQVCADAAAFSGAVQQARGLNRIARMNTEAAKTLSRTALALKAVVYPTHEVGQIVARSAEIGYKTYNVVNLVNQQKVSLDAAKDARHTAEEVTRRNEPNAEVKSYVPPAWGLGHLVPATGTRTRFGFFFHQPTPYGDVILYDPGREVKATVFRKLVNRDTIFFTARVRRPSFPWLFDWTSDEGPGDVRNLRAYATAKPAGGTLWADEQADPQYRVKLVRTGSVFPQPSIPDSWGYEW